MSVDERFWAKVDVRGPDECWPWLGRLTDKGYGRFDLDGRNRPAHAVAVELGTGQKIPAGLEPDHLCGNRACQNYLQHLELVTHAVNVRRAHPPKEYCKRGHRLTPEVLYISPRGKLTCRDCKALRRSGTTSRRSDRRLVARARGDRGGVEWGGGADRRNRGDRRRAARRASDQPSEVLVLNCEVGIVAVCADDAGIEPALREYFRAQEADAASDPEWPPFTLHGIEIDEDVWHIRVTSPGYPDPNEGPAYQYGYIERWPVAR